MNIIVTGGSRGIGREVALSLSENRDNQILITGRNEKALKEVAKAAVNENIIWFTYDLSGLNGKTNFLAEHIGSLFSIVDILINNAGSLVNKKFVELKDEEIRRMMDINYFAPAMIIKSLLPLMKRGSHIVNISSMGGYQGSIKFPGLSCYSASKAAIACLTECLANEFSESGISINSLALGSVSTEMLEEAFPGYKAPLSSKEMGEFIAWFAMNGNRFFNGKILPVALSVP